MSAQAQVTSIESLESFRSDLIIYLGQMLPALDEAGGEVMRMRHWLQVEQRGFWDDQLRRRRRKLEEAQAQLFNKRISLMNDSTVLAQMELQRAQRAVAEAEQKITALKKWSQELERLAEPLVKQVDSLRGYLTADMAMGVIRLTESIKALDAYTRIAPPSAETKSTS